MKTTLSLVVVVACIAIFPLRDTASSADRDNVVEAVDVRDIGTKVALIGRLGQPLGTAVTVDGTWGFPDRSKGPTKDGSLRFIVHRVNDRALPAPVPIDVASVSVTDQRGSSVIPNHEHHGELAGVTWKLRAYETGRFTRVPQEYWEHRGSPAMRIEPAFASALVGFRISD